MAYVGVSNALINVAASGARTLSYQWWHGAAILPGQTNAALVLPSPTFADAGHYTVAVTDVTGASLTSAVPATLRVKLCEPPPADLVAWWPGDGHFFDVVGTNTGTVGAGVSFVPGVVGQAFRFVDATNSLIQLPNSPEFQPSNNQLTIAAWIKPDFSVTGPDKLDTILAKREYCSPAFPYMFGVSKGHRGYLGNLWFAPFGENVLFWSAKTVPNDGQFHHVAVAFDGHQPTNNCQLYLDGELVGGGDAPGVLLVSGTGPVVGAHADCGLYSSMDLDELGFFNRALNASEIQALYAANSAGMCKELKFLTDLSPTNQTRGVAGQAGFFQLLASGTHPLNYQWRLNGAPFTNTAAGTLTLTNLQLSAAGRYDVVVSDATGLTLTNPVATLNMLDRQPRYDCLAGWWPGEGNANDALGLNDGSLQGGAGFTDGIVGQAFNLNGTDAFVQIPDSPSLSITGAITVAAWIKPQTLEATVASQYDSSTGQRAWVLNLEHGGHVSLYVFQNGGGPDGARIVETDAAVITAGIFTHVAASFDLGTQELKVYVNGIQVPASFLSSSTVSFLFDSTSPVRLGASMDSQGQLQGLFSGLIDEVSLYNCALSADEVANLYNMRPALPAQTDRVMPEITTLVVTNTANDPGLPFNTLTYTLLAGPTNATFSPDTGLITWTPTEAQGPSSNRFVTVVTDNGLPPLRATNEFSVLVNEVNLAPSLTVPGTLTIDELTLLNVSATATDPDLPTNPLIFEKIGLEPVGLTVGSSGQISWMPTEAQGPSTNTVTVRVFDNGTPLLSTVKSFTVIVREVNQPPALTVPVTLTIDELTMLSFSATATDPDLPANTLTFEKVGAEPAGLTVSGTGQITWMPTEAQGPSPNIVTVRVFDNGTPSLSTIKNFTVIVREVNTAPVLPSLPLQTAMETKLLTVNAAAADADLPVNALTYALLSPPDGVTLSPAGMVTWTPAHSQAPGTHTITVKVTDWNNDDTRTPQLSATNSFTVQVEAIPVLTISVTNGWPRLMWNSAVGRRYQVRVTTSLEGASWTNLGSPLTATGTTSEFVDASLGINTRRFYQLEVLFGP